MHARAAAICTNRCKSFTALVLQINQRRVMHAAAPVRASSRVLQAHPTGAPPWMVRQSDQWTPPINGGSDDVIGTPHSFSSRVRADARRAPVGPRGPPVHLLPPHASDRLATCSAWCSTRRSASYRKRAWKRCDGMRRDAATLAPRWQLRANGNAHQGTSAGGSGVCVRRAFPALRGPLHIPLDVPRCKGCSWCVAWR